MKHLIFTFLFLLTGGIFMNSYSFEAKNVVEKKLGNGKVEIYDFGKVKLHAYMTSDALSDTAYLIETDKEFIGIETPAFYEDLKAYSSYIKQSGKPLNNLFLAYHTALPENYKGKVYATENYVTSVTKGSIKGLLDNFKNIFGDAFDTRIPKVTNIIKEGKINVAGVDFIITNKDDGYMIEIPACSAVYIHMAGSDVHNILPSIQAVDSFINDLEMYKKQGYNLILTSHYKPETVALVDIKTSYLKSIKEIYAANKNKEDFIASVKSKYPKYTGENYLQITADMLYK